jgi:hypothetical protein
MDVAHVNGAINEVSSFCGLALRDSRGLEIVSTAYPMLTRANMGCSQNRDVPDFIGAPDMRQIGKDKVQRPQAFN